MPLHDSFHTLGARIMQIFIPLEMFVFAGMGSDGFHAWNPQRIAGCAVVGLGIAALMKSRLRLAPRIYGGPDGLEFFWIWEEPRHVAWSEIRELERVTMCGIQYQPRFRLYFVDGDQDVLEFFAEADLPERLAALRSRTSH